MINNITEADASASGPLTMDARVKLITLASLLALVLSSDGMAFPALTLMLSMIITLLTGRSWKLVLLRLAEPLVIVSVLILLKSLTGDNAIYSLSIFGHDIVFYSDGLMEGLMLALRIMAAIGAVTVVSLTTPFADFLGALSWLRVPGPFVEVALFAHRYLRNLFDDAQVIYSSQKIRLGYSSPRRAFGSLGTLAGSLLIKAFDQAEATAASLHQRGYDGTLPLYDTRPFKAMEVLGSLGFMSIMAAIWVICRG